MSSLPVPRSPARSGPDLPACARGQRAGISRTSFSAQSCLNCPLCTGFMSNIAHCGEMEDMARRLAATELCTVCTKVDQKAIYRAPSAVVRSVRSSTHYILQGRLALAWRAWCEASGRQTFSSFVATRYEVTVAIPVSPWRAGHFVTAGRGVCNEPYALCNGQR